MFKYIFTLLFISSTVFAASTFYKEINRQVHKVIKYWGAYHDESNSERKKSLEKSFNTSCKRAFVYPAKKSSYEQKMENFAKRNSDSQNKRYSLAKELCSNGINHQP